GAPAPARRVARPQRRRLGPARQGRRGRPRAGRHGHRRARHRHVLVAVDRLRPARRPRLAGPPARRDGRRPAHAHRGLRFTPPVVRRALLGTAPRQARAHSTISPHVATPTRSSPDRTVMVRWWQVRKPVNRRCAGAASSGSRISGQPRPSRKNRKATTTSTSAPVPRTPPITKAVSMTGPVHGSVIGPSANPYT